MIDTLHQIVTEINLLPEYLGKGILELIILIVGGIVVGWITPPILHKGLPSLK